MSNGSYDAIVVGARCAGSPTAMLLARKGHRVLLLDKATFPSDTMSTHFVHPPGRGGARALGAAGAPRGDRLPAGRDLLVRLRAADDLRLPAADRRDRARLLPAAHRARRSCWSTPPSQAGAELREGFTVDEILAADGDGDGHPRSRQGRRGRSPSAPAVVIGADGRHSLVAKTVRPEQYDERPSHLAMYYAYWSGLPAEGFDTTDPGRAPPRLGGRSRPTTTSPSSPSAGRSRSSTPTARTSRRHFLATVELAPEFAERVHARHARVEVRRLGRAARLLPQAVRPRLGARRRRRLPQEPDHGDGHQRRLPRRRAAGRRPRRRASRAALVRRGDGATTSRPRDHEALPVYEFTDDFAQLQPPPPEMQQLLGAMRGNQEAMDDFVSVQAAHASGARSSSRPRTSGGSWRGPEQGQVGRAGAKKSMSSWLTRSASSWWTQCDASGRRSTRSRLGTSSSCGSARFGPRYRSFSPQMTSVGAEMG